MKMKIAIVAAAIIILILGGAIYVKADHGGVTPEKLEQDARKRLDIADSWEMSSCIGTNVAAVLFYDKAGEDYTYAIYRTKEEPELGYYFLESGTNPYMEESAWAVIYDDRDLVLMSLNNEKVAEIVFEQADDQLSRIAVEPEEPFACVIEFNYQKMTLYDGQGSVVTVYDTFR